MRPTLFFALALCVTAIAVAVQARKITDAKVRKVHRSAILINTHNDITSRTVEGLDIGQPAADTHTGLVRMKDGGMAAEFFAVYVGANYVEGNHSANRTLQMIDTVRHDIAEKYLNSSPPPRTTS